MNKNYNLYILKQFIILIFILVNFVYNIYLKYKYYKSFNTYKI